MSEPTAGEPSGRTRPPLYAGDAPISTRPVPPGGTLGIFAASGPFDPARYQRGLERLRALGFAIVEAPGIELRHGFLAGDDATRVAGLLGLLERSDVHGLVAARGGYGLTRILHRLPPDAFRRSRKPVLGFSDVTALHAHLSSAGLEAIHGPVVTQLPALSDLDLEAVGRALRGEASPPLVADGPVVSGGRAEGPLWGGNLAVLTALVGTPHLRPPREGMLLLLEDVGEATYRVDRLLTQLLGSGVLERARGVALGDFRDCRPAQDAHPPVLEVLSERLAPLGVPVVAGFPIGHGARNRAVRLGRRARLDADARTLEILP